jgi:alanine racemase
MERRTSLDIQWSFSPFSSFLEPFELSVVMRCTKAIIHLENLRHNIRLLREILSPGVSICMAVKADAYGHGAVRVARAALEEGVGAFGIATVQEGDELRTAGIDVPILLLSPVVPSEIPRIVSRRIAALVSSEAFAHLLAREAERQGLAAGVHIKIDTGMGRLGCRPDQSQELAVFVDSNPWLELRGVCTHFPVADTRDCSYTLQQLALLRSCVERIRERGVDPGVIHAANSGAILGCRESHLDMVRPGIMLYGYYPSKDQDRNLDLRPVMELTTKVAFLKKVERGTGLSYGLTYTTSQETVIATLPVGYADGYSRLLSNRAEVAIRGERHPVVGRVCMDQTLVDLGRGASVELYDDVTLFGPGPGAPSAETIADLMHTIPYEVTCLVGKRVPRVFVDAESQADKERKE